MPRLVRRAVFTTSMEGIGDALMIYGNSPSGTINWVGANVALFVPLVLPQPMLAQRMIILNGSSVTGNVDAGIYTFDGAKIVSSGAVAHAGTNAMQLLDITDTLLARGRYYMAVSLSSGSSRIRRSTISIARMQGMGILQASSAHVLPASVTFISPTVASTLPHIGVEGMGVV